MTRISRRAHGAALRLAAALIGLGWLATAEAADTVFIVAKYPVEARADNAVAAKTQALADGQQAAFRSLLKRLVPVTAYPSIRRLASVKAGDLIDGYKVRSERNSATEYIASLDFSFQSKAVRDLLRREGIPFSDDQAPALTVIPVWRDGPAGTPREEPAWTNVWKGLDLEHTLTPVTLQTLRKEIQPSTVNALAGGDGGAIRSIAGAYRTEHVLIAVAESDPAAGRLNIILSGRDAVGAFTLRRSYRLDASDPGYTNELAAVVALRVIEGRWKATKIRGLGGAGAFSAGNATDLLISVEFRGMSEWQDISRKLASTPGIDQLEVAGLSARGARVTLRYAGGTERLTDALAEQGLALRNAGGNWIIAAQ
ncbi:MAG TPA: DUF2066 domain-containing protein [Hyphomicrobiaceae bacterium]|nr:DUF2066 domain-containing protein [Hyphomicrobiaceae bacterium]